MTSVRKAVFPVAGFGTRFLPATKAMPKELLPIIDKPVIQFAVEEAVAAGIDTLIFVTGRHKRSVEDHFDANLELEWALETKGKHEAREMVRRIVPDHVECIFVRQPEALGLGDAVLCARRAVGEAPFAVLLADDFMLQERGTATGDLIAAFERTGSCVLSVAEVAREEVSKYGIVSPRSSLTETSWHVAGLVEKPSPEKAPSQLASFGRYLFTPKIFEVLEKTGRGAGNEIQLADAIDTLARSGGVVAQAFEGRRFDCGDKIGYVQAVLHAAAALPEAEAALAPILERLGYVPQAARSVL